MSELELMGDYHFFQLFAAQAPVFLTTQFVTEYSPVALPDKVDSGAPEDGDEAGDGEDGGGRQRPVRVLPAHPPGLLAVPGGVSTRPESRRSSSGRRPPPP